MRHVLAWCAAAAILAPSLEALGQGMRGSGMNPGGMGGPPAGGKSKKAAPKKPEEETHAASNPEAIQSLQTQEPTLPPDPLAIPPEIRSKIGTDFNREVERAKGIFTTRTFYGPYYEEISGQYRLRSTIPPLWAERTMPGDRASLYGFYYNRRSLRVDADLLFPLFAHMREDDLVTTVVTPFMHRERPATKAHPGRHDNWLFPLFLEGESTDGTGYLHVPPLLTYSEHTARDGLNLVGPMYCKWKGGPNCDVRTADSIDMGLAPLYVYGRDEKMEYEIIPPLLHYYRYTEAGDSSWNIWGPVVQRHTPEEEMFTVFPFYWRTYGKNEASRTVFPLFHYGYKGDSHILINPLYVDLKAENGDTAFATWVYAQYRGRTEFDMITPFYWNFRDPDIGLSRTFVPPIYYRNTSPRSDDIAIFPLFAHFKRPGLREVTWATPLARYAHDTTGWETDLFPLLFAGRMYDASHVVVPPVFWYFDSPRNHVTVVPPVFFRVADTNTTTQIAANTYFRSRKAEGDWEFHFFPMTAFGSTQHGYWWNFLYGLAGYSREGTESHIRAVWLPIKLSE